jgi:hypothetical protein
MTSDDFSDIGSAKGMTAGERAQWGLASLLIGAVLILASLVALIFNVILWQSGPRGVPKVPDRVAAVSRIVGAPGWGGGSFVVSSLLLDEAKSV